ncbi:6113_t:CDS:10 [Scutellospora calospora]|uniref:6113_t:CDS:1 n=1 Tax=Scutellospora calospora TaxID=85575 RepID=A0ACA9KCY0_9GLOM|nr:6113_t:CDS:10 [Scutellospora calospora]
MSSSTPKPGLRFHKRTPTGLTKSERASCDREILKLWEKFAVEDNQDKETFQKSFVRHVTTTLARSVYNIDDFSAYHATANTVRDSLIKRWNDTQQGVKDFGFRMEDLLDQEVDAALGNGGLGRLAACYMDSIASLDYPAWGYGLRYTYGIFQQRLIDGYQVEFPDYWLNFVNPWELPRLDIVVDIQFGGSVTKYTDEEGYGTRNCINIRLWSSKPKRRFDLKRFNEGEYEQAVQEQMQAENITSVLYPNDNHMVGKELRLKQQYFWVAASLYDIVRRFKKSEKPWSRFPDQVAIQLNDTHPTLAIVELQRILVDIEGLGWDDAWDIVTRTFSFTNHTILPEAMEKWPVPMVEYLLPRHMQIIFDINLRDLLAKLSIIEESTPQFVRMAHLAIVGSHYVNGVAELHSNLIKTTKLDLLKNLESFADDKEFKKKWMVVKRSNKVRLANYIETHTGVVINPNALFDIQVKRIHEYKRQFMNILSVIHRYNCLKKMSSKERSEVVSRAVIFGGKAAPGYYIAKLVIKLINSVAEVVNKDRSIEDTLKVVFIPDYNVSVAEIIIPASDISQHISTAGTEASGTSNMKFVLNGGLILGTVDGANIEILEEIGEDNIFMFGNLASQVEDLRHAHRYRNVPMDPALQEVINDIESGHYGDSRIFAPLISTLTAGKDYYLISDDFGSYLSAQGLADEAYKNQDDWTRKSIICSARMGKFSSDRAIQEYAERIWNAKPVPLETSK